jgi:hypothetical protein
LSIEQVLKLSTAQIMVRSVGEVKSIGVQIFCCHWCATTGIKSTIKFLVGRRYRTTIIIILCGSGQAARFCLEARGMLQRVDLDPTGNDMGILNRGSTVRATPAASDSDATPRSAASDSFGRIRCSQTRTRCLLRWLRAKHHNRFAVQSMCGFQPLRDMPGDAH